MSRLCVYPVAGLAIALLAPAASAQPLPLNQRTGGVLVGDLTLDAIYLTRDLNHDGDARDAGEFHIYFDASNASGLPSPTRSVFSIFQSASGYQFYADGSTDTVYRLRDWNHDGDALDPGEANVWFSASGNAAGFPLPTPNGIYQDASGATYITNAGVSSAPQDVIYRTVDLNHDGDAQDPGEATIWMDLSAALPNSTPFDLTFVGDVAFIADLAGGDPDMILRAEDLNHNGVIDPGEWNTFIDETNPFGVRLGTAVVTNTADIFVMESVSSAFQQLFRLSDTNGSGAIDDASEITEVWNESLVPPGFTLSSSFDMAVGPDGELLVTSAGATSSDNIFRLVDLNHDGDFLDAGETIVWADGGGGSGVFIDNPRTIQYIPEPASLYGSMVVILAAVRRNRQRR